MSHPSSRYWVSPVCTIALALLMIVGIALLLMRTMAQTSAPAVPCTDSDGGLTYDTKGKTTGIYVASDPNFHRIFGQEPNPSSQKETTDAFSTYYDYCRDDKVLDEAYCNASGYLSATGWTCPYGCSNGACQSPPASAPASIALSVQSAGNVGLAYRPGMRMYFSMAVTDTLPLKSVFVTTSPMMYSSPTIWMNQCTGQTMCEEKVYIIVPATVGSHFITVTVTSGADQVSTKTVNFETTGCTTDAECGGGAVQWAGASYCGSENGGLATDIMQNGVAATCKAGGICDTSSLPRVKQKCASGQACAMVNHVPTCIVSPLVCAPNTSINNFCFCGNNVYSAGSGYCCTGANGSIFQTSPGPCPAPVVPSLPTPSSFSTPTTQVSSTGASQPSVSQPSAPAQQTPTVPSGIIPAVPYPSILPQNSMKGVKGEDQISGTIQKKKKTSAVEAERQWQLLRNKLKSTQKKITKIEKNIRSLEKKIDGNLRFLETVTKEGVQKRVNAQIDRWQEKIDALEEKETKLEAIAEKLQQEMDELKALVGGG